MTCSITFKNQSNSRLDYDQYRLLSNAYRDLEVLHQAWKGGMFTDLELTKVAHLDNLDALLPIRVGQSVQNSYARDFEGFEYIPGCDCEDCARYYAGGEKQWPA